MLFKNWAYSLLKKVKSNAVDIYVKTCKDYVLWFFEIKKKIN